MVFKSQVNLKKVTLINNSVIIYSPSSCFKFFKLSSKNTKERYQWNGLTKMGNGAFKLQKGGNATLKGPHNYIPSLQKLNDSFRREKTTNLLISYATIFFSSSEMLNQIISLLINSNKSLINENTRLVRFIVYGLKSPFVLH